MCEPRAPHAIPRLSSLVATAPAASVAGLARPPSDEAAQQTTVLQIPVVSASRKRRLWELESTAYCPVVGVCLPLSLLRRLVAKTRQVAQGASDYDIHRLAVSECHHRSPLAEAMQKELDRRYALTLRATQQLKSAEALSRWWDECRDRGHEGNEGQGGLAGALWAVLTHPRCEHLLEQRVLGEVHMLQHQVGTATRADLAQLEALMQENAALARELASAQARCQQQGQHHTAQLQAQQAETLRLRALLIQTETRMQLAQDQFKALQASAPNLPERQALAERNKALQTELQQTRQELRETREHVAALQFRVETAATTAAASTATAAAPESVAIPLQGRAVLCVGGRQASVPVYRELIEHRGARFLHHDGGSEESNTQLDATLAAADLVICQAGCISHNAYWRVKDHCKRTGKQCVFVEQPSRSALDKALSEIDQSLSSFQSPVPQIL